MRHFVSCSYVNPDAPLINVQPGRLDKPRDIKVLGSFRVDGRTYLLPVLSSDADPFEWYYGVTEVSADGTRYVEKIPDLLDVPDDGILTDDERRALKRPSLLDHIVHFSTLFEVTAIRGVIKLKSHVERIRSWKK
jgi:hypothetical protein